eukprot:2249-Chlamydomonas_euryale.AAC.1
MLVRNLRAAVIHRGGSGSKWHGLTFLIQQWPRRWDPITLHDDWGAAQSCAWTIWFSCVQEGRPKG